MAQPTISTLPFSKPQQKSIGVIHARTPPRRAPMRCFAQRVIDKRQAARDDRQVPSRRSSTQRSSSGQSRGRRAEPTSGRDRRRQSPLVQVKREERSRSPLPRPPVKREPLVNPGSILSKKEPRSRSPRHRPARGQREREEPPMPIQSAFRTRQDRSGGPIFRLSLIHI